LRDKVVVSVYVHLDPQRMPLTVPSLVHLLVSFADLTSTSARVLLKVMSILKDLVTKCDSSSKEGMRGDSVKHVQETITHEFFSRENKYKLLFFELNSSRLDTLAKINRMSLIVNYSSSFGLDVTTQPSHALSELLAPDVLLLYHASLVELFSLCFDDCSDLDYLRCLSFETVMTVLQTMDAYNCPPLVHAYGLYLHRVFLRGNGSVGYLTKIDTGEKTWLDISEDDRLYDALSKLCAAAMAPESLLNSHRALIFDVTIPCLRSFLTQTSALAASSEHPVGESQQQQEALFKLTSQLLLHLMDNRDSLARRELLQVAEAWQAMSIPVPAKLRVECSGIHASSSTPPLARESSLGGQQGEEQEQKEEDEEEEAGRQGPGREEGGGGGVEMAGRGAGSSAGSVQCQERV
jgi:hypothetical protein